MPSTRESLRAHLAEQLGDRFRIVEELGFGGMAVVYLAENLDFGRLVALKVLRPDRQFDDDVAVRFRSEAIAIAQLRHPHIIGVHARGEDGGLIWFEMDYIEGGSLEEQMTAGPMDWRLTCRLLAQAADGLGYAHTQGIIHRDIKPSNLLLAPAGDHLTITDFGIAKIVGRTTLTETGVTLGTIAYMSPEQLVADREITGMTDQYSLGVVAYEAIAGKRPYPGDTAGQVRFIKTTTIPSPLEEARPDCPPDLQLLISRMLAPDPAHRWPDLATVKRAAEEIALLGASPHLRGVSVAVPSPKAGWGRWLQRAMVVATVVLVGVVVQVIDVGTPPEVAPAASAAAVVLPSPHAGDRGGGEATDDAADARTVSVPLPPPPPPPPPPASVVAPRRSASSPRAERPLDVRPSNAAPDGALSDSGASSSATPAPAMATFHIASQVPGTFVHVNGSDVPHQLTGAWLRFEVPAGVVRLRIRKEGCADRFDAITLAANEVRRFRRTADCPDSIP